MTDGFYSLNFGKFHRYLEEQAPFIDQWVMGWNHVPTVALEMTKTMHRICGAILGRGWPKSASCLTNQIFRRIQGSRVVVGWSWLENGR
jgi:hypothetical protein